MKWLIVLFFLVISSSLHTVKAQNETVVLGLSATEFNGKVLLTWEVTQGNTCNGILVFRGTDTTNYVQIGSIEGICGSTTATIKYQFTDAQPNVNETNYYRLNLSGFGYSYPTQVEVIDAGNQTYIITPNPLSSDSQLIFNNENHEEITVSFFNEHGEIVQEISTSKQSISLDRNSFHQGVYFFVLKSNGALESFSGRFVVI